MATYKTLSDLKGNKISLLTKGWSVSDYTLTDGLRQYGRMYNEGLFSSVTIFETNGNSIIASVVGVGDITLKTTDGKIIAQAETKFFTNSLQLTLSNGLKATLNQPNIWRMKYIWTDDNGRELMEIVGNIRFCFDITVDNVFVKSPNFLPVLFAGVKYVLNQAASSS